MAMCYGSEGSSSNHQTKYRNMTPILTTTLILLLLLLQIHPTNPLQTFPQGEQCENPEICRLSCPDGAHQPFYYNDEQIFICTQSSKADSDWYIGDCGVNGDLAAACRQQSRGEVVCDKCVFEIGPNRSQNDVFRMWRGSCSRESEPGFGASVSNPMAREDALGLLFCEVPSSVDVSVSSSTPTSTPMSTVT